MDPDRWKQVEELCHAALEREESGRAAFLEQACAGDEALRRRVEIPAGPLRRIPQVPGRADLGDGS